MNRRSPLALSLAALVLSSSSLSANGLEAALGRLSSSQGRCGYGQGPWVSGVPEGYRFSRAYQADAPQVFHFNVMGFLAQVLTALIAVCQNQAPSYSPSYTPAPGTSPFVTSPSYTPSSASLPSGNLFGSPTSPTLPVSGTTGSSVASGSFPAPQGTSNVQVQAPGRLQELAGLSSPDQIDLHKAEIILDAGGFFTKEAQMKNSGDRMQKALRALAWGWTFKSQTRDLGLDVIPQSGKEPMRTLLFWEYQRQIQTFPRYANLPTLTRQASPREFDALVAEYAPKLNLSASSERKVALLRAQIYCESSYRHWMEHKLYRSWAGAGGANQVMAGLSLEKVGKGLNYYDPKDGLQIGINEMNDYLRRSGGDVRTALAMYNGGPGNYRSSGPQAYARKIMARAGW